MGARPTIAVAAALAAAAAAVVMIVVLATRSSGDGSDPTATRPPTSNATTTHATTATTIDTTIDTTTIETTTAPVTSSTVATDDRFVGVPDVVGRPEAEAIDIVEQAGFVVGAVEPAVATERPGVVVRQSPAAGELRRPGTPVDLAVSIGDRPPDGEVVVPDLGCLTLMQATEALESAGLSVGEVTYSFSGGPVDETWLVERQRPGADTSHGQGEPVDLQLGSPIIVCT